MSYICDIFNDNREVKIISHRERYIWPHELYLKYIWQWQWQWQWQWWLWWQRRGKDNISATRGRDIFGHMTHIPARHPVISSIWESLLLSLERFKQEHKVSYKVSPRISFILEDSWDPIPIISTKQMQFKIPPNRCLSTLPMFSIHLIWAQYKVIRFLLGLKNIPKRHQIDKSKFARSSSCHRERLLSKSRCFVKANRHHHHQMSPISSQSLNGANLASRRASEVPKKRKIIRI